MTLIAGVVTKEDNPYRLRSVATELQAHLSRVPTDSVLCLEDRNASLLKVDIGAYGQPAALSTDDGKISVLAGHPLLSLPAAGRWADLTAIHRAVWPDTAEILRRSRGAFCAALWDPCARQLTLVADKNGTRPLYYHVTPGLVVFASALRILLCCQSLRLRLDPAGALEAAVLGYSLSDRTPYAGVRVVLPGEAVQIGVETVKKTRYWSWSAITPRSQDPRDAVKQMHAEFQRAVQMRLGPDISEVAFLSGGLDSRCVVAALKQAGKTVYTFNFSLPGQQDLVYARRFAAAIGSKHNECDRSRYPANPPWAALIATALDGAQGGDAIRQSSLVWSGDGGSVALGCVYMSEPVVGALRLGDMPTALRSYLSEIGARMPRRVVRPPYQDLLYDDLLEEARGMGARDDLTTFHLLLMRTDQFRHLHADFEDIDLNRTEYQLPFLDGGFLECVLSNPVDSRLRHCLYHAWLGSFDPAVSAVPWQTYPGHLPCPVADASHAVPQWGTSASSRASSQECADAMRFCFSRAFPSHVMSRGALAAAAVLHRMRLHDSTYAVRVARRVSGFLASASHHRSVR